MGRGRIRPVTSKIQNQQSTIVNQSLFNIHHRTPSDPIPGKWAGIL